MKQLEPTIENQSIAGTVDPVGIIELLNAFAPSFFVAFIVTLLVTPLVRKLAIALGVIDQPGGRKIHTQPIAYLGGLAVFLGIMAGVFSAAFVWEAAASRRSRPVRPTGRRLRVGSAGAGAGNWAGATGNGVGRE